MKVVSQKNSVGLKFSLVARKNFAIKRYFKAEGKFVVNFYPVRTMFVL